MEGIRRAPRGSGAGGGGTRPDLIAELVHHSNDFADALFGYHSYMAHGPPGTGNGTQPFEEKLKHDSWARLLYLPPQWLLVKPRGKRQLHAREVRRRVNSFMANEWRILDKAASGRSTTRKTEENNPSGSDTRSEPTSRRKEQKRAQNKIHQKSG